MEGTAYGATNVSSATLSVDDPNLGEEVDARLWYVDSNTGHVWQRVTLEGDDPVADEWQDAGVFMPPSAGGGGVGDGLDPPTITGLDCVSVYQQQVDGTFLPVLSCTWAAVSAPDLIGYELEWDVGYDPPPDPATPDTDPPYVPPSWVNQQRLRVGKDQTSAVLQPVIGGRLYDVRARAYDAESRVGVWATDSQTLILPDNEAPKVPTPSAYAGYRMMGVRWDRNEEADLDHYEVRIRRMAWDPPQAVPPPVPARAPYAPTEWVLEQTRATLIVFNDLAIAAVVDEWGQTLPPYIYEAQVRAVDTSNNVRAVADDPYSAVDSSLPQNEDAGWSVPSVQAEPSRVGQSDIVFDNVIIGGILDANAINARYITTGSLSVGGVGYKVALRVYDSTGKPIGVWGEWGWVLVDAKDSGRAIWGTPNAEMKFTTDFRWDGKEVMWGDPGPYVNPPTEADRGTVALGIEQGLPTNITPAINWTTALDASGINAESITFGSIGGGHNRMLNAGFELVSVATASVSFKEWTVAADWDDATATAINLLMSGTELKMTAV